MVILILEKRLTVSANFSVEAHGYYLEKFFSEVFETEIKIKAPLNPIQGSKINVYEIAILGYNGNKSKIFLRDYRNDSDLKEKGVELLIIGLDNSDAVDLAYWTQKFINERLIPNL